MQYMEDIMYVRSLGQQGFSYYNQLQTVNRIRMLMSTSKIDVTAPYRGSSIRIYM